MAGTRCIEVKPPLTSSKSPKMAKQGATNWRKEVDESAKRLQSLLFGATSALESGGFTSSQILTLRLLGFLDSRARDDVDEAFIRPIRLEARSLLDSARRALTPESDRQAFEGAGRAVGKLFSMNGDIDVEKIKNSKNFRALFQANTNYERVLVQDLDDKCVKKRNTSSIVSNTKLTTSHVNDIASGDILNKSPVASKSSISGNHVILDPSCRGTGNPRGFSIDTVVDEVGIHGKMGGKRAYMETRSPINECLKSTLLENNIASGDILDRSPMASKSNISGNCVFLDPPCPGTGNPRGYSDMTTEEVGIHGNMGGKLAYMGTRSPINESSKSPLSIEEPNHEASANGFISARSKLEIDAKQKRGLGRSPSTSDYAASDNSLVRGYGTRSYPVSRRGVRGNFVPPIRSNGSNSGNLTTRGSGKGDDVVDDSTKRCLDLLRGPDGELPEKLRNLEPRLIEHVSNEVMDQDPNVRWDDIAGLEHAKKCVTEMVVWPLLRPDIFKGCRAPGRGLLLFGPPGTGKTMIGKAIAGEAKATFFYISASSLTSKWIGEGEKLVRALFGVASCRQPAVIFVDEIDSLLSQRKSEGEHEASRRLKTQFLIEMEGFDSGSEQILLIGATNRPQELDEAARRRLTKRLYIPLPSSEARAWIIRNLLEKDALFALSEEEVDIVCKMTEGYSGSDMKNLVKDASMGPLRDALKQGIEITQLNKEDVRHVTLQDFKYSVQEVRPSVSFKELGSYEEWNKQFGSLSL